MRRTAPWCSSSGNGPPGTPLLPGGPFPEEEHHGAVLRIAQRIGAPTRYGASARCRVDLHLDLRLLHGRRLHADSARHGGVLRDGVTWQAAGADHHGILAWSVGSAVDCGKNLRFVAQL